MKKLPDFDEIDREFAYSGELGAIYSHESTEFRVWSPKADKIQLKLYRSADSSSPYSSVIMEKKGGVWSAVVKGDLHGTFYTYSITFGSVTRETIDIYAKTAGANGVRGMVVDLQKTNPDGWEKTTPVKLEDYTDAVIYELHVRDFSADESGNFKFGGKFKAFTESRVTNKFCDSVGLDYIADLGVTHIHLLPVFDYQTVDESDPNAGFNWGYDPLNYNMPEGSYSTDPNDGVCRIMEFKELIQAAHKKGVGVIMDVVYNHTYSMENSPFTKTYPDYYYRHNSDGSVSDGSACGNEFASEREMAGKFIYDSLCYLAEEYKLDGFRFDLMGLLDVKTLNRCAEALRKINPSIILYGEGWTGVSSPLDESLRAMKSGARKLPQFAMFSDDFRDGVKGSVFDEHDCGYVSGKVGKKQTELMKSVISGGIYRYDVDRDDSLCWTDKPQQAVNYVEAHDNLTLYDKLKCSMPDESEERIIAADKMAATLVFLSQGIPFIQAGQEFLRSKPDEHGGFVHDSYNSPDSVNSLKWNDVTINRNIVNYYKGLIALRKHFPQLRMRTADEIREKIKYEDCRGGLAVHIDNLILCINPTDKKISYDTGGSAKVYADSRKADIKPLYTVNDTITINPNSIVLAEI